jgi:hypothetical protein
MIAGKSYQGGRLSTVDLLKLPSLDQLIFKLKILFSFFLKKPTSIRRSTVLILPPQLVFPDDRHQMARGSSTVEEQLAHSPKIGGLIPSTVTRREKMAKTDEQQIEQTHFKHWH